MTTNNDQIADRPTQKIDWVWHLFIAFGSSGALLALVFWFGLSGHA